MHRNEVTLAGRLSLEPAHRNLPSGALLTQWRLAVRRPGGRPGQRSDAIECATFDDGVRDMLAGWQLDDLVEVEGALRRRWWRGGSRYEIEVHRARRVEPAVPAGRRRRRTPRADDGTAAGDATIGTAQVDAEAEAADVGEASVSDAAAEATQADAPVADAQAEVAEIREASVRHGAAGAFSGGAAQPAGLPGSPGGQAAASPAPSSCHQHVADSAQPAGEVVSQWRRSA
ncbi:single-stranded DNA-binding protein [Microbispora sp. H13382]|uniref:single-stranded DNA-binding protein n=1 Tax=Microbispora sp. H13382 TaxID=2729112 RepID=UPI0016027A94|nr:single-stranded DNA-binding protein [Microbispora sp. H13382]